jgi:hypothetical protein
MDCSIIKAEAILESLGHSAAQVAMTLDRTGIKGVRNTVRILNPIVEFVEESLPDRPVSTDVMKPGILRLVWSDGTKTEMSLPSAVSDFLVSFNDGNYPRLEAAASECLSRRRQVLMAACGAGQLTAEHVLS